METKGNEGASNTKPIPSHSAGNYPPTLVRAPV